MEKSENCDPKKLVGTKKTPNNVLSRNELALSPQGVPTQFAPLVVETKERPPSKSSTGVTFRK